MATCAACLRTIERGERAKLAGSEVFHKTCSTAGSALRRATSQIAQLRAENERLHQERDLARQDATVAQREAANQRAHADNLARARELEREQLHRANRVARANAAELEQEYARSDRLEREIAAVRSDARAARQEAELLKAVQPPQASEAVEIAPDSTEDATVTRGKLLEFD